jgi:hypothetical protein
VATLFDSDACSGFSTILQCSKSSPVVMWPHCSIMIVAQDLVQYYSIK